jgi:DNA-binding PadR family transcriptional regulator
LKHHHEDKNHEYRHHHDHRGDQPDAELEGRGPRFGGRGGRGGPEGRPGRGRGDRRARRGDIRGAILVLLAEQPMHGYQLMQEMAARTDGAWRPSPGAIYPALSLLEDEGYVVITREGGRKLAALTDEGRAHIESQHDSSGDPFAELRDAGDHGGLRNALEALAGAVRQVARTGTPEQRTRAEQTLVAARRTVYLVLADVDTERATSSEEPTQS